MRMPIPGNSFLFLLGLLFSIPGYGQDLFNGREANSFAFMQKVPATQNMRGYPILGLGNEYGLALLKTSYSTPHQIPLGNAHFIDIMDGKFVALLYVQGNLGTDRMASDWTDEPCKSENFLWKRSTGRQLRDVNCASINHIVRYFVSPTGDYQQFLIYFREKGIDIPPTIVRVVFTRYSERGARLIYQLDVNPEFFGIARDSEQVWGANGWHKRFIQKDARKTAFLAGMTKWAEDVQVRMDRAFEKDPAAFAGMPEFGNYIK